MSNDPPDTGISVQYNPETNTYKATFEETKIDPSIAVIEVMASIRDTEPTDLDPLYAVIDPAELDAIVRNQAHGRPDGDCVIEFVYLDHRITVKSYGIIEVEPL